MNSTAQLEAPPRRIFKRRGRIVWILLAVLIVVGIGPLATMAHKLIDINREALTTAHQEYQLLLASSMAHELDVQVEADSSQLLPLAHALSGRIRYRGSIEAEDARRDLAEAVHERMPYVRYSYFQQAAVASISAGELPHAMESVFDAGLRNAAEDVARHNTADLHRIDLSEPILLDTTPPRAVLVASVPVVSRGAFQGVLSALIDVQALWEAVCDRTKTGHSVFALDQRGSLFASSALAELSPGQDVSASALVQRFVSQNVRARETMPFVLQTDRGAERYLGSYVLTRQGWGIFVQARERQVYLPIERMIESTRAWVLAALALAAVAALFFARTLADPVNRLAAASRAFARGDLSTRVAVRSGHEIGELAHTFNVMAEEIEVYISRLRQALADNEELFRGTIRAMAEAIDAKDPYTRGHSMRVNRYSVLLAEELGLQGTELRDIDVASLLHDVGKIGIDDAILKKPGALSDEEYAVMKTHTTRGATILEPIRQMARVLPGLRWHHERCGGGGYPDGLVEAQIPLMARIIAVADTFDAITTNRPYQRRMTFDEALSRLAELRGHALDGRVVDAFGRLFAAGKIHAVAGEPEGNSASPAVAEESLAAI